MTTLPKPITRREFTKSTILVGATLVSGSIGAAAADAPKRRIRTGLIGCGSVSHQYLPQLTASEYVEVVSLCDIRYERAQKQGEKFKVQHTYSNVAAMLAGEPFEFLVLVLVPALLALLPSLGRVELLSPLGTLRAGGDMEYKSNPDLYWISLGIVQLVAWLLFSGAALKLRGLLRNQAARATTATTN